MCVVWTILISELASKQFKKMDKSIAKQILDYLNRTCSKGTKKSDIIREAAPLMIKAVCGDIRLEIIA